MKTIYQLHDSETEEILGAVMVLTSFNDEVHEAWTDYNKLEEHEHDPRNIEQFVVWCNQNYVTQIEQVEINFVQP